MATNLDRYRDDLTKLIALGDGLYYTLQRDCDKEAFDAQVKEHLGAKATKFLKALPSFGTQYQSWYSEAKALLKQLLPDRLSDFVRLYEKPKPRKDISYENYRIEDCLQGLHITRGWEKTKIVGPEAALPHLYQQIAIIKAVRQRFDSSLFDIRQLVQVALPHSL